MAKSSNAVTILRPPTFTAEDQEQIVTDLLVLKKAQIGDYFARRGMSKSGTKDEMRTRIEDALADGSMTLSDIVQFLDDVIPWGKQHVYLYKGPQSSIRNWRNADWLTTRLKKHRLGKYLNARLSLVLPEKLKVSSILHDGNRLRITAIKKREWWERDLNYDSSTVTNEGDDVELRAFVHRVTRSLVAFEWDLVANTAFLQISQLPSGLKYEDVAAEFFELVAAWLDIKQFSIVDLRPAIKTLDELEDRRTGETRSHGNSYRTMEGRTFEGKSASPADPLLGDPVLDPALRVIRNNGVGRLGNFYWLPGANGNPTTSPLDAEIHVIIVGAHNRINFPTPNVEETVRYVLSRIRSHST